MSIFRNMILNIVTYLTAPFTAILNGSSSDSAVLCYLVLVLRRPFVYKETNMLLVLKFFCCLVNLAKRPVVGKTEFLAMNEFHRERPTMWRSNTDLPNFVSWGKV